MSAAGQPSAHDVIKEQPSLFPLLQASAVDCPDGRVALEARWLMLTREVLPGLAVQSRWPISNDHCFMRVCLDAAIGAPWHTVVKRPAIRHLTSEQLKAAIAVAEAVVKQPEGLQALNRQSIGWRRRERQAGAA